MLKIGFIGIPCTGKTELANALYQHLRKTKVHAEIVNEAARTYIQDYGFPESLAEFAVMVVEQADREDCSKYYNTDVQITEAAIPLVYLYIKDVIRMGNEKDSKCYSLIWDIAHKAKYDILFYIPPTLPAMEDGVRPPLHLDSAWRKKADADVSLLFTTVFKPKMLVTIMTLSYEDRLKECVDAMARYETSECADTPPNDTEGM